MKRKKIVLVVLMATVLTASIFFVIANLINYYKIPSEGIIPSQLVHPYGKLHIGNETLGENPCFFYDENGRLVTLRILQSGHRGQGWYTNDIYGGDFAGEKWCNATIKYARDGEFNCLAIHMFWGAPYVENERLYPSRQNINDTLMDMFLNHLRDLADNNLYYILDGFDPSRSHGGDWWLAVEMENSTGGLFWNTTVKDDFVWLWNETLTRIKSKGENVWNHLVFFDPWREWLVDFSGASTFRLTSRDPYRFNQSQWKDKGYGNDSLVSWQNWVKKKYDNDITQLKDIWGKGRSPAEYWNASGKETDDWKSLLMPVKAMGDGGYNRAYDFSCWYCETIKNFTQYCSGKWKASFPDVYLSWGGQKSAVTWGATIKPNDVEVRSAICYNVSDVITCDDYGTISHGQYYWGADGYAYSQEMMRMVARALKKPYVTTEFGPTTNGGAGYSSAYEAENTGCWNLTLQKCLRCGYAGYCPYWTSYWHSFETGAGSRITRCDARRPYVRQLNLLYKAAENWIDKIQFDPICLAYSANDHYGNEGGSFAIRLWDQAGYNIKYTKVTYDNETILTDIPSDTEILVFPLQFGSAWETLFTKNELKQASDWLNSNPNKKIIFSAPAEKTLLQTQAIRFEDYFNTTLFPLSPVTYGTTYKVLGNTTDVHVDIDGTSVLLNRSNYYHSAHYLNFSLSAITGKCLINYTDGDYPNQPMTIINDRVCWIGSNLPVQCGNPAGDQELATSQNSYLIIRKILSYWGYKPKADITQSYHRVGYVFNKLGSSYGIQGFYSLNYTDSGIITPKFNFTRMGLSKDYNYVVFSTETKSTVIKTPTELENGISISLCALNRENLVVRRDDSLCYLYSSFYLVNETLASSESLTCIFTGVINQTDTAYFYFPYNISSEWKIKFSNGTIRNAEDYYDNANKLIKISFKFRCPTVVISIHRISASSQSSASYFSLGSPRDVASFTSILALLSPSNKRMNIIKGDP